MFAQTLEFGYGEVNPLQPPNELMQEMQRQQVKIIIVEPYFDLKTPDAVARGTQGKVLVLSPSVGGVKEASSYLKVFDYNIKQLIGAIRQVGAK